ncbi:MAG: hypothetical protein AAGI37_19080 [Planctomycetota bacterium]
MILQSVALPSFIGFGGQTDALLMRKTRPVVACALHQLLSQTPDLFILLRDDRVLISVDPSVNRHGAELKQHTEFHGRILMRVVCLVRRG